MCERYFTLVIGQFDFSDVNHAHHLFRQLIDLRFQFQLYHILLCGYFVKDFFNEDVRDKVLLFAAAANSTFTASSYENRLSVGEHIVVI